MREIVKLLADLSRRLVAQSFANTEIRFGRTPHSALSIPHLNGSFPECILGGTRARYWSTAGKIIRLCKLFAPVYYYAMSSVQEIEAVLPKLSRAEIEEVRAWIDDFLEDQLELTDEVKAKLDQSRREISEGNYTTRQPK